MTLFSGLMYRNDFSGPDDRVEVSRLLRDIFGLDVAPLQELSLWDPTYRAFSFLDMSGCCIANVATFTLPLIVSGRSMTAMGIQSVATRPAWRGRGLSHHLLRRALLWCDGEASLVFLMTSIPEFYEPFGFKAVPQFKYVGDAPPAALRTQPGRKLRLRTGEDRALLAQVLRRRTPVSAQFAVDGLPGAFVLNLIDGEDFVPWHLPHHDAVVVSTEHPDGTLCIIDIAARAMPNISEILAGIGAAPPRLEVHFPPDYLGWSGRVIPAETTTVLMVRGELGLVEPFMFPETASF